MFPMNMPELFMHSYLNIPAGWTYNALIIFQLDQLIHYIEAISRKLIILLLITNVTVFVMVFSLATHTYFKNPWWREEPFLWTGLLNELFERIDSRLTLLDLQNDVNSPSANQTASAGAPVNAIGSDKRHSLWFAPPSCLCREFFPNYVIHSDALKRKLDSSVQEFWVGQNCPMGHQRAPHCLGFDSPSLQYRLINNKTIQFINLQYLQYFIPISLLFISVKKEWDFQFEPHYIVYSLDLLSSICSAKVSNRALPFKNKHQFRSFKSHHSILVLKYKYL